jgi:ABC-type polysaccharide/polyol phosphate export permease
MTGIFFDIGKIKGIEPWNNYLLHYNPIAFIVNGLRDAIMYQTAPDWKWLIGWTVVGIIVCAAGNLLVYKYENTYGKVL